MPARPMTQDSLSTSRRTMNSCEDSGMTSGGIRVLDGDPVATGGGELGFAARGIGADRQRRGEATRALEFRAPLQEDRRSVSRKRREGGAVSRPDPVEPEAERVDEIAHVPVEVRCGDTDLGAADQVGPGFGSGCGHGSVRHRRVRQRLSRCEAAVAFPADRMERSP